MKKLYDMDLGDIESIHAFGQMTRVPGGWIYTEISSDDEANCRISSVFVPFNNEFMSESARGKSDE